MPYMIGANPAYMYNRGYLLINRTKAELEKLKGVTVINITEDHLFLPADFDDYFSLFPSISEYEQKISIPIEQKDTVLPPLPQVNDINLYTEVHILFYNELIKVFLMIGRLLFPQLVSSDSVGFTPSLSFSEDAGMI